MNHDQEKLLQQLREAARVRKWNEQSSLLLELLFQLDCVRSVELALNYVKLALPVFEQLYPADDWVKNCLDEIEAAVANPSSGEKLSTFAHRHKPYPDVTARTFQLRAMWGLWEMARFVAIREGCIDYAHEAICGSMATIFTAYERKIVSVAYFGQSSNSMDFRTNVWLKLADDVEISLRKNKD